MTAAAQADRCPASQAEYFSLLIDDFKVAFNAYRTVVANGDLRAGHPSFLPPVKVKGIPGIFRAISDTPCRIPGDSIFGNRGIHLVRPCEDAALKIPDFPEARALEKFRCLGRALAAAAVRDDLARTVEFADAAR